MYEPAPEPSKVLALNLTGALANFSSLFSCFAFGRYGFSGSAAAAFAARLFFFLTFAESFLRLCSTVRGGGAGRGVGLG